MEQQSAGIVNVRIELQGNIIIVEKLIKIIVEAGKNVGVEVKVL